MQSADVLNNKDIWPRFPNPNRHPGESVCMTRRLYFEGLNKGQLARFHHNMDELSQWKPGNEIQ